MKSWNRPVVPELPGKGHVPVVFDTASSRPRPTHAVDGLATLYVCGITPYDATHLGHAATYLAFDTLVRLWLDAGFRVRYVQNVTDVDDPLLERAADTDRDWEHLAAEQVDLFRADMEALGMIPPDDYVAVTEVITPVAEAVQKLVDLGLAYVVDDDVYFDSRAAASASPWRLGSVSGLSRERMLELAVERGGDPGRPGKRDPLDPLLWRAERPGEPSWPSSLGPGRPGWHIECSVIAQRHLDLPATVNGGGSDLTFPHHEFSAAHSAALGEQLAGSYVHAGMVGYHGEKMSKSLGNLVLVSQLRSRGIDPRAIRLAILAHHYRSDWEWHDGDVDAAVARLARWQAWAASAGEEAVLVQDLRDALRDDLNTPAAIAIVDDRVAQGVAPSKAGLDAIAALLGVELRRDR